MASKQLACCDEVVVLRLEGWKESTGVQAEIAEAGALGKPLRFLDTEVVDTVTMDRTSEPPPSLR
jgi:uncharacterized protein DUF1937